MTDGGTLVQPPISREPVERGGWSVFTTSWPSVATGSPATNTNIRGQGAKGWLGWFDSPRVQQSTQEWLSAGSPEQQSLMDRIQQVAFGEAPIVPLGIVLAKTAFRKELTGILPGPATFLWDVRRA